MVGVEDISITGFKELASHRSSEKPGLYSMVLALSADPDPEWIRLFAESRSTARNEHWRTAVVSGGCLIIVCEPHDLQNQIDEVKNDIRQANLRFREIAQGRRLEQKEFATKEQQELDQMREIASRLRF